MRLEQEAPSIFYVKRHYDGRWKVTQKGYERPIAFFGILTYAKFYANKIASVRNGSKVLIDYDGA